jgi:hypothetical protein
MLGAEACAKPGCSPKAQLLAREEDAPKVFGVMRQGWEELLAQEGMSQQQLRVPEDPNEELPCPACGTQAPLQEGACSDCGLQLE